MLVTPETLNLGGIDGLYMKDNRLFVIQNGIKPQRLIGLELDASGTQVTSVTPMAIAQPDFDYPNYGTLQGEHLYYFANSQWSGDTGPVKPVAVLRTPVNSGNELVQPDMRLYLEKQAAAKAKKAEEQKQEVKKN